MADNDQIQSLLDSIPEGGKLRVAAREGEIRVELGVRN